MALSDDQKAMLRLLAQREQGYGDIAALMGLSVDDVRAKVKDAVAGLDSGLSQDQRAMLRLQAQREDGYDDIGALMGLSVDDVRAKVRDALAELEGADAGPVEAPPVEKKPEAPKPPAEKPKPAAEKPKPPVKARPVASSRPKPKLPQDKGALRALAAGGAVVFVIVLLLVTGVLGDDGGDDSTAGSGDTTASAEGGQGDGGKTPTQVVFEPVGGLDASGRALFGRDKQAVVLLLRADGLPPSPKGRSYTVSLVRNEDQRLPLIATKVGKDGVINGSFEVAAQVLGLLASGFDEMEISLVEDDTLRVALAQAQKAGSAPEYGGVTVMRGQVTGPIVTAAEDEG